MLARAIREAPGLIFAGIQAYQGSAQHLYDYRDRKLAIDAATQLTVDTVETLAADDLHCEIVGGAGTGSYYFEAASGVYNELQCGSYVFMDADYAQVRDQSNAPIAEFKHSLFILTSIMSKTRAETAVCDAGLKVQSIDSGLPTVFGRHDVVYSDASDEHGVLSDTQNSLTLNERIKLVPGHCDPTCNLHDWYVGVRGDVVECLWPVTARGKAF